MPIVCLEGPSAVGKTTAASALAAAGACVVPEVNELFSRPAAEAPDWYLERQVERWTMAARAPGLAILDGDPFQPLWYNWSYGFDGWQPLDELAAFHRPRILRGDINFPDQYVILGAPAGVLRAQGGGRDAAEARLRRAPALHRAAAPLLRGHAVVRPRPCALRRCALRGRDGAARIRRRP
ncbi:MAG TPA: AAA family ATPase [Longimicrobium sp.]|jgi:hypothetical protein